MADYDGRDSEAATIGGGEQKLKQRLTDLTIDNVILQEGLAKILIGRAQTDTRTKEVGTVLDQGVTAVVCLDRIGPPVMSVTTDEKTWSFGDGCASWPKRVPASAISRSTIAIVTIL